MFRRYGDDGRFQSDAVALAAERVAGTPLLAPVMQNGKRIVPAEPLEQARRRVLRQLDELPAALRELEPARDPYRIEISDALRALAASLDTQSA